MKSVMSTDRVQLDEVNETISRLTVRAASHLALIGLGNQDVTVANAKALKRTYAALHRMKALRSAMIAAPTGFIH